MRCEGGAHKGFAIRPLEESTQQKLVADMRRRQDEKMKNWGEEGEKCERGVGEMDEMEKEAEDVPDEARRVKKVLNPHMPTNAEREEHVLTHLPYRNWCRHCVRGRGKEAAHTSMEKDRGNGVGESSRWTMPSQPRRTGRA